MLEILSFCYFFFNIRLRNYLVSNHFLYRWFYLYLIDKEIRKNKKYHTQKNMLLTFVQQVISMALTIFFWFSPGNGQENPNDLKQIYQAKNYNCQFFSCSLTQKMELSLLASKSNLYALLFLETILFFILNAQLY